MISHCNSDAIIENNDFIIENQYEIFSLKKQEKISSLLSYKISQDDLLLF